MRTATQPQTQPQPKRKTKTLDPKRASLMGRIGGATTAARYTPDEMTRSMFAGLSASWERKADPDGVLAPAERARRAEMLRKAHYAKMSLARWGKSA